MQALCKKLDARGFFLDIGDTSSTLYFAALDGSTVALKHVSTPEHPDDYAEESAEASVSNWDAWIPSWMPHLPYGSEQVRFTGWSPNDITELHYVAVGSNSPHDSGIG